MPLRSWCGVPVAVTEPIDQAVEPPSAGFFSINRTSAAGRPRFNRRSKARAAATDNNNAKAIVAAVHDGDCAARWPAVVPAILPNTEPAIRPVPPG